MSTATATSMKLTAEQESENARINAENERLRKQARAKRTISLTLSYVALALVTFLMIFPLIIVVIVSFTPNAVTQTWPPKIIPSAWTLDNYTSPVSYTHLDVYKRQGGSLHVHHARVGGGVGLVAGLRDEDLQVQGRGSGGCVGYVGMVCHADLVAGGGDTRRSGDRLVEGWKIGVFPRFDVHDAPSLRMMNADRCAPSL